MKPAVLILAVAIMAAENTAILAAENATLPDNPIFKELVERGITLANGKPVKLPRPIMGDNLDAAAQRAAIEKVSDARHPAADLLGNSRYAPVMVKIGTVRRPKARRARWPVGRSLVCRARRLGHLDLAKVSRVGHENRRRGQRRGREIGRADRPGRWPTAT